jgi:predicted dehydrogenase
LKRALVIVAAIALAIAAVWQTNRETPAPTWRVDLAPGNSFLIPLGPHSFTLAVPSGPEESHSLGRRHAANDDGQDDATIVNRSAGSGGYITVLSLLSGPDGYRVDHLPGPPGE